MAGMCMLFSFVSDRHVSDRRACSRSLITLKQRKIVAISFLPGIFWVPRPGLMFGDESTGVTLLWRISHGLVTTAHTISTMRCAGQVLSPTAAQRALLDHSCSRAVANFYTDTTSTDQSRAWTSYIPSRLIEHPASLCVSLRSRPQNIYARDAFLI